jgi:hypothetical protein|tara:strand:- start:938 stop:1288 length:351 start_codon:yes stop_codon:yes gene_type:complete
MAESRYLMLFRGGDGKHETLSPEESQQHMQKWLNWINEMKNRDIYCGGSPLEDVGVVVNPDQTITDGPFTESKELIGGYIVIEADSAKTATEEAMNCPILCMGGRVEVRRVVEMCE